MKAALTALLFVAVGAVALPAGVAAQASQVQVSISAPQESRVGDEVQVQATLRSAEDNAPVAGAEVTLHKEATFAGVTGDTELARATTNEDGVAFLSYEPRTAGQAELTVEYTAPDTAQPEAATVAVSVAEGPQQHRSTAGIRVPGLNVWLLIAVLAAVWGILFSAALMMRSIAGAGVEPTAGHAGTAGQARGREYPRHG
jgi:uncharacterized protein (DUF58 family)